ncbi:MAG: class I SAM-dependent rRNA methyltransferase [Alphaproteobacteria bacterium]
MMNLPTINLKKGSGKRFINGCPWVFSNEIEMSAEAKEIPDGSVVILTRDDKKIAVGTFNCHSLIAFRAFSRNGDDVINKNFIEKKVSKALAYREAFFDKPYYRLVFSEADNLPGFVVDRLGDIFSIQANTAGAEMLSDMMAEVLLKLFPDASIVFKNDTASRKLEGLELYIKNYNKDVSGEVELIENDAVFFADIVDGQKTGWFYDQRDNRALVAKLAKDKTVADFYSYAGGFSVLSALNGAISVTAVDRSERAVELAQKAALRNGVEDKCQFVQAEAFSKMEEMAELKQKFGVVVVDPPAFIKSKKDFNQGAKGYQKMARLASKLVEKGGFLVAASCSHHINSSEFLEQITQGIKQTGRTGKLIKITGAGADHPVHISLPEMSYLKALFFQLD